MKYAANTIRANCADCLRKEALSEGLVGLLGTTIGPFGVTQEMRAGESLTEVAPM